MSVFNWLGSNIFKQPPLFMGILAMLGLILQRKSIGDVVKGTEKTIAEYLREKQIDIADKWIGRYSTTQEMAGFALSLCAVDEEMLRWYKAPAETILKF